MKRTKLNDLQAKQVLQTLFLLWAAVQPGRLTAKELTRVSIFTPQGQIKDVRQVHVGFSEPMMPFGDPRGSLGNAEPFEIDCPQKGAAHWVDPKNWVFDFDENLSAGLRCVFKIKSGVKSLSGHELSGPREFSFSTGGPSIISSKPYEGARIEEEQAFILTLDAEVDESTVLQNARFQVEGIQEEIPIKLISGKVKDSLLASVKNRWEKNSKAELKLVLQARRVFPSNKKVTLIWGKGIASRGAAHVSTSAAQNLSFQVREPFAAHFSCDRESTDAGCIPFKSMNLTFSAPVPRAQIRRMRIMGPGGKEWKPAQNKSETKSKSSKSDTSSDSDEGDYSARFEGPFPEHAGFKLEVPKDLQDDSGRVLSNATQYPLLVRTEGYPPLAKFASEFGIIESKPEPVLPVTLRNLEPEVLATLGTAAGDASPEQVEGHVLQLGAARFASIVSWMRKMGARGDYEQRASSVFPVAANPADLKIDSFKIPKPNGAKAFEVVGIPLPRPGFYVVEIESKILGTALLGADKPMFVSTAALVTNLSVHLKKGRESSLVWVTALDSGKPVSEALVAVRDCHGHMLMSAQSNSQGIVRLGPFPAKEEYCGDHKRYSDYDHGLFVTAEKAEDFSFVHTSWQKGIETWRFNLGYGSEDAARLYHTVMDRTLFRAGETVHMKHFARKHTEGGIAAIDRSHLPATAYIHHSGSDQKYELPLKWEAGDVAESTWKIPAGAKLGEYDVRLGEENRTVSFRVEEYRVPLMKAALKFPSEKLVAPESVSVDALVAYLAGGGASLLPVQARYQQSAESQLNFPDFEEYTFANGAVSKSESQRDSYGEDGEYSEDGDEVAPDAGTKDSKLKRQSLTLDATGSARIKLDGLKKLTLPSRLSLELEYRDPNGEIQTASANVPLYPSSVLAGIRPDSWYASKKSLKFSTAVVNLSGKPVANTAVEVEFYERKTYSHRKKLIGGFYAYENHTELHKLGKACSGHTDSHGLFFCDTVPPVAGNILLEARTKDDAGNPSVAHASSWVYDSDEWWFAQDDNDRIDILPEKKKYEPGDKAVFQVRMPFREATALVTVEREGVIDAFTVPISGKKPLVEVPIKASYSPNVYVSILAVRGRAGEIQPSAMVDLGKPAYKLGISELQVGWKPHELKVKVTPAHEVYQVRDTAQVAIDVTAADGSRLPKGSEVAIAVVDEGLLLLKPNESWKLLEAMMKKRGYEVETSSAQMQVVGKRHFGLKALPHGGDGGKSATRELFDTLLFWKARVPLDGNGHALVSVPLNDSITAFRVVAIADAGLSRFGTGSGQIRSTRDLMMFSGIAPLAREGDLFPAEVTLRNSTTAPMQVEVSAQVKGLVGQFAPQVLKLAGGESKTVRWNVTVPGGLQSLDFEISARSVSTKKALDRVHVVQKILPAIPVRTFQATLVQLTQEVKLPVQQPKDAVVDRGEVRVVLRPTILAGLEGVTEYMSKYPYSCLEQRSSKAVALKDEALWQRTMADLPSYLDPDGLAKYFPSSTVTGSDALTSYLISLSSEVGWEIPESARESMLGGLKKFVSGSITRGNSLPTADLVIRKIAALDALSRSGEASWNMLGSIELEPNLWPTSAVIDWKGLLSRIKDIPQADTQTLEAKRLQADQILHSRLHFQGSTLIFSTEKTDALSWLMVSPDENANRLLLAVMEKDAGLAWKDDLPRLARGAMGRQHQGHWDTTTGNAWGVLAMEKFAREFEKYPVTGETRADLGRGELKSLKWANDPQGGDLSFAWPKAGAVANLSVRHSGQGRPWLTVQSLAAIPLKTPLSAGYKVTKSYSAVERKKSGQWSKGDIVRVHLALEAQADMSWVVLQDPIPAGATILGTGLGNDSGKSTAHEKRNGDVWTAYEERTFDSFRSYYEFVPKGKWSIEYTFRLNQSGQMNMPSTRLEAMYSPEMMGETPNERFQVSE